jgi:ArsR family transcriptional regulator
VKTWLWSPGLCYIALLAARKARMSVDKIFEALSSAPRRRILAYLSKTDMTAGEIADRFAQVMSQPAISKHLSVLENAGLVWREKRGQNVHYGLKEDALTGTLVHFLAEVCPRSRPFTRDSAAAARRKRGAKVQA